MDPMVGSEEEETVVEEALPPVSRAVKCSVILAVLCAFLAVMCDWFLLFSVPPFVFPSLSHSSRSLADLIVDFGVTDDIRETGFYAGFLVMAYYIGTALGALPWSFLSDKYGRRAILLISIAVNIVCPTLLCFSTSYWYMVAIRFVNGAMSGILPVVKIFLGEHPLIPPAHLSFAFSGLQCFISLSQLIGSFIGGALARPVAQYPHLFVGEDAPLGFVKDMLQLFPILLPNAVFALISSFAFLLSLFLLRETNATIPTSVTISSVPPSMIKTPASTPRSTVPPAEEVFTMGSDDSTSSVRPVVLEDKEKKNSWDSLFCCPGDSIKAFLRKDPIVILCIYFILQAANLFYLCSLPILFAMPRAAKGLGLTNFEIGLVGNVEGFLCVIVSLILPFFMRFFNPIWMLRLTPLLYACVLPAYPSLSYLDSAAAFWSCLMLLTLARALAVNIFFTIVQLITNNCVTADYRGTFQGVANTIGTFGKMLGPFLGSQLIAIGALVDSFPIDVHLPVFLVCGSFAAMSVLAFMVPTTLSMPVDFGVDPSKSKQGEEGENDEEVEEEGESLPPLVINVLLDENEDRLPEEVRTRLRDQKEAQIRLERRRKRSRSRSRSSSRPRSRMGGWGGWRRRRKERRRRGRNRVEELERVRGLPRDQSFSDMNEADAMAAVLERRRIRGRRRRFVPMRRIRSAIEMDERFMATIESPTMSRRTRERRRQFSRDRMRRIPSSSVL